MRREKALSLVFVVLLVVLSALVLVPSNAAAASKTWTTDTDFNEVGAEFTATEVVGTGVPASVQLLRDYVDWANKSPAAPPTPRESPGFTFAGSSNLAFLFGGYDGFDLEDTWQYDVAANAWTRLTPNPHPPGREAPGFSYDSVENVIVLFGGINATFPDVYLTDTWEFNVASKTWSQVSPPASPGRMVDTPLVYDASASRHILVGGNATTGAVEAWAYDAAANTWASRTAPPFPPRTGFALAYHAFRQRTVLFGGFEPLPFPGTPKGDTWEYRYGTNSWALTGSDGSGPTARSSAAMTYKPASQWVILFGGGSPPNGDTWRYTAAPQWQTMGTLNSPPARNHAGLAYDAADDVAILFGGRGAGSVPLGDTWTMGAAYEAGGLYLSSVFNSGGANVQWGKLWWNRTAQPANTFLRMQIATSTIPNPVTWSFRGPDYSSVTYYTIAGTTINVNHNNQQYLRFRADFGSFDSQVTPVLEDVTIGYNVPPAPPYIASTDPSTPSFNVPLNKVIRIIFSEPMNTASVSWQFLEGTPVSFSKVWSNGDSILDLTHTTPFRESMRYRILFSGTDLDGNALVAGPVPNPIIFVTAQYPPYIVSTNPPANQMDVPLAAPIVVTFNESMNTSTLRGTITPDIDLTPSWNAPANTTVTLTHTIAFTQCTDYTVNITQANDTAGLALTPGPKPNPWTFTSLCINPYLTSTSPYNLQLQVAATAPVWANFSKSMSQPNTTLAISPDVAGKSFQWSNADKTLKMSHTSAFPVCTPYTVTASGTDTLGNPLAPGPRTAAPNPFKFMTVCGSPFIVATRPADGDTNVSLDVVILVAFSESMDEPSVQFTITPSVTIQGTTWRFGVEMDISTTGLAECTQYTVHVTAGRSSAGFSLVPGLAPNPWRFSTICESPYITSTDPANGDTLVPLDKAIVVTFSAPMNTTSVVANPSPTITLSRSWSNNNQTLTLTHTAAFQDCTQYTIFVDGLGADGRSLLIPGPSVPDPWVFTTICLTANPYIIRTDPAANEQNVDVGRLVVVQFSEPMNPSSLRWTFVPNVAGVAVSWSVGDTTATLNHNAFTVCTVYTVTISAQDVDGNGLVNVTGSKPNPWSFRTACGALPAPGGLQVIRMPPTSILLAWRAVPGASSYLIFSSTNRFAAWPWTVRAEVTTTSYLDPSYAEPTPRYYVVRAKDSAGAQGLNSTMGVKVPLTFAFTTGRSNTYWLSLPYRTMYRRASDISNELTSARIDVVGKWDPVRQTSILWYLFRGQWRGTDFTISAGDGLWIGTRSAFIWVVNGTDGAVPHAFAFNPTGNNVNWISLPYTSTYAKASDLVLDLEGSLGPGANTKIVEVGKWDGASQSLMKYYWTTTGWTGADFTIASGEGVYFKIVVSFAWTPRLITPEVP